MGATILRAAVTIFGAAAYFALSVIGWGGPRAFFAHPAFIAFAVVSLLVAVVAVPSGGNLSAGQREDRSNRWVLPAFGILGLLIGYFPALTDRLGFWTMDGETIRWVGVVVFAAGCVLRIWPVYVLGDRFSGLVAIQPNHALVTTGVYRIVRNPSYLGLLLQTLGMALTFRSIIGLALVALLLAVLIARIRSEEALLRDHFGQEYEAYRARTWRLIPGIY